MLKPSAWVNCLKKPCVPSNYVGNTIGIAIQFNYQDLLLWVLFLIRVSEVEKDAFLRNGFNHHGESDPTLPAQ